MAYVESSVTSALAHGDEDEDRDHLTDADEELEEAPPERPAVERKKTDTRRDFLVSQVGDINLAHFLSPVERDQIGMDVVRDYEIDELSRADWLVKTKTAMKLALHDTQPKNTPWEGASNMVFPLVLQAAIEFQARAYGAIVQNRNVVKGTVWGSDRGTPVTTDGEPDGPPKMQPLPPGAAPGTEPEPVWLIEPGEKRKRADRIGEHMSWQLLSDMPEWEPQTDQMLMQMPVTGGAVRKTFWDPVEQRNKSLFVSLVDLTWNYGAPSFEAAPRHTEKFVLYPHEIVTLERIEPNEDGDGMFMQLEYGVGGVSGGQGLGFDERSQDGDQSDTDAPHLFLEQHRRLDLDEDGYDEPYVVTVHKRSSKVVRIVARYDEEDIDASEDEDTIIQVKAEDYYTLYPFFPNIDGGSYPMGFGHFLRPLNEAINTTLNQMFDAGTLQNAGGGFISDQLGVPSGQTLFKVGKYTRVNAKGGSIRESVFPIPFQGPSPVLYQLLGVLMTAGKELASIGNILTGDAAIANAPPTTILALIEQGMKVYTGIHKRIYRAEKAELAKLYRLNRKHIKVKARYQIGDEWREVTEEDYRLGGGVEPIADPTMTTDMQKLGRGQILMGFKDDPLINQKEIRRRLFDAASIDRIDELWAAPPDAEAAAAAQQMAMAMAQAQLGKVRAEELDHQSHAFLNMSLARKNASAGQEAQIDAQLEYIRLRIEGINSLVKASAVDSRFHDSNTRAAVAHAQMAADQTGDENPAKAAEPTPAPAAGNFPAETGAAPSGPDVVNASSPGTGTPPGATPAPLATGS